MIEEKPISNSHSKRGRPKKVKPVKIPGKPGPPKGSTNNPNGRPVTTLKGMVTAEMTIEMRRENAVTRSRDIISKYFTEEQFELLFRQIEEQDDLRDIVRAKFELLKLLLPRPTELAKTKALEAVSSAVSRFFGVPTQTVVESGIAEEIVDGDKEDQEDE